MKGMCSVASGEACTFIVHGKEQPEVGGYYYLESAKNGTQEQNKAFHALVLEFFKSGQHSYDIGSFKELKDCVKKSLGVGFESFVFVQLEQTDENNYHCKMYDAKTIEDIPQHIKNDPYMKDMIRGKLKSWSNYTKKERTNTIDNLIVEMKEAGVNSAKFDEILSGMGD